MNEARAKRVKSFGLTAQRLFGALVGVSFTPQTLPGTENGSPPGAK